ncbi:putative bifunctional diguanylate cyclase/phosphodiesterase [Stutzerimonas xanthomarina]|uniref:Diguanylate cyclase/phosphodiesterase n=2 Tax=Stutzerimonas xanthomarina TaxID=271420 RepID=A0A1M5T4S8_9GAMM|nr:bifunctional diguanylate cyclase/phosphodiesterase [Stutzerimonas xanthomarina]MCP9339970.1 bifunctional diguanylate cyclase/phosphodiesterase [Stutzerimonas xanthomarina]SEH59511.1 diguanylate cyclase (GGDEF) domain-containing protein [Stutzerimonas xanthomarina]SHH45692.1 diguanylate cyclase/phosphodiesterase [Stutzerimonas xanthomarina DSM 18231]
MRLVLLADEPEWRERLQAALASLRSQHVLLFAKDWPTATAYLAEAGHTLLLATPRHRPASGRFPWPTILLLDTEPDEAPEGVVDWLNGAHFSPEVLRRCLRYARERCALHATLQRLAQQDPLTGIANRQGFQTLLEAELAEHDGEGLALGLLDLDNFRRVNDTLGHQAGDRLILQVVARLKAQLEVGDRVARLGGDEFALLIDTAQRAGRAEKVADRVVEALAEPYWLDGESLMLGCSLGLAHAKADTDPDQLLWLAQVAMRQAKARQGCTWYLYNERVNRSASSLADLEGELRRALRRDDLELHYQPRLCMETGRIVGLEALVRWRHASRGLLAPNEFIPMAEESGLIVPLGYWVISRALRDMQSLREKGAGELHMAVNLSFRQFQDSQLLATLQRLIEERGVDPHWLEFELTETAVMRRSDQVSGTMSALAKLGVRFSLDDFGTGFSSFVHLSRLPISLLKIDKSFVDGVTAGGDNGLVQAMISLAHELGLEVVAEGVEQAAQLKLLEGFGANQVQGYLISKPLPLAELEKYLSQQNKAESVVSA